MFKCTLLFECIMRSALKVSVSCWNFSTKELCNSEELWGKVIQQLTGRMKVPVFDLCCLNPVSVLCTGDLIQSFEYFIVGKHPNVYVKLALKSSHRCKHRGTRAVGCCWLVVLHEGERDSWVLLNSSVVSVCLLRMRACRTGSIALSNLFVFSDPEVWMGRNRCEK